MAISLISDPESYQPAFNPIEWKFSSTNIAQCDFQFICDVSINGAFVIRLKAEPEGASNYGIFRLERIFQDYLSYNFRPDQSGWIGNNNSILQYSLEVRERYNTSTDCTGTTTLSAVLYSSSGDYYAWNGALSYHQYLDYDLEDYVMTNGASKFLTNSPSRIYIGLEDNYTINFLQNSDAGAEQVYDMVIETYNSANILVGTYVYVNTLYVPANEYDLHVSVGVGPAVLNTVIGSPAQTIITSGTAYYKIYLRDSSQLRISQIKTFVIDQRCSRYRKYRLWWRNRLGGFDSYNFHLKSNKSIPIQRSNYTRLLESDYVEGDRGETVIDVDARETYTFSTDFMTEPESKWMEELFTSSEVYAIDNSDTTQTIAIDGVVNSGSVAHFVLPGLVLLLPTGTTFSYTVNDGSPIGMANSGTGTITGFDSVTGYHKTDVPSSISAGAVIVGDLEANIEGSVITPIVITSNAYSEKLKSSVKNISYTIEARSAIKLNTP